MAVAERPRTSAQARDLALREVADSPWIQQRELATRLHHLTGLAESTLVRLLRRMEAEGSLRCGLSGPRKTYALPESGEDAAIEAMVETMAVAAAQPKPSAARRPPVSPRTAPPVAAKPGWPMPAVVSTVLAMAVLAAVLLTPEKRDPYTGSPEGSAKPVAAEPAPLPDAEPLVDLVLLGADR